MNDLNYRANAFDELPIFVPIVFERFQVFLKQEEDGGRRVAALNLIGERIVLEIYASLLSIFICSVENRLKVRHRKLFERDRVFELGGRNVVAAGDHNVLGRLTIAPKEHCNEASFPTISRVI